MAVLSIVASPLPRTSPMIRRVDPADPGQLAGPPGAEPAERHEQGREGDQGTELDQQALSCQGAVFCSDTDQSHHREAAGRRGEAGPGYRGRERRGDGQQVGQVDIWRQEQLGDRGGDYQRQRHGKPRGYLRLCEPAPPRGDVERQTHPASRQPNSGVSHPNAIAALLIPV